MRTFSLIALLTVVACGGKNNETAETGLPSYATGTGTGTGTGAATGIAIAGSYTDSYGGQHTITDTSWVMGFGTSFQSTFHITAYDNSASWAVAENDASNSYSAGLWSRFDWTVSGPTSDLYFCQTGYGEATEAAALALPAANATDLGAGCGGFPWSQLQ